LRSFDGQIAVEAAAIAGDPSLALRVYTTAVDKGMPVLPFTRDIIARLARDNAFTALLRESPDARRLFVELVCTAQETGFRDGSVLPELHDVGLLTAMIPEFAPVVGRVHHDLYHVYTVDVHSVAAVDRLRALVRGDLATEYPLACRLAAEITRPVVLFLATLLHDIGKAIGGKDHSGRGADMAGAILGRLGLRPDEVAEGCHLIRQHLVMYHLATRRDLEDRSTIQEMAQAVHGREGLCELYLLTVADLSTTSPTSMTTWKARMLDDLYLATDALLSGQPAPEGRVAQIKDQVCALWTRPDDTAFVESFVATMPERYVLSTPPEAIAAHGALAREAEQSGTASGLVRSRYAEAAELCIVAPDRPGLLAAMTAAITAGRLEVHRAEIHSRTKPDGSGQAVDLFWVRDRIEGAAGAARAMAKLGRDLAAVLGGQVPPRELAATRGTSPWAERPAPAVRNEVSVEHRDAGRHTIVEVFTRDRPGLLFTLANALHELGLSIGVAKINTEGHRVADVFYVTEADGSKILPGVRILEVRTRLLEVLEQTQREGTGA
jgi:[protein-PII] uridylyltransferase